MNLTVDVGNTRIKYAVFENSNLIDTISSEELSDSFIEKILKKYSSINKCILSSVKDINEKILSYFRSKFQFFIELKHDTNIPIENLYETKSTLGKDRLAAVIGANNIYPNSNVLVIDMGTAITFDFINQQNQYHGGTISPGLEMRFKALNHFTNKLPLLQKAESYDLIAKNTKSAIISGIQNGIIFEVDGYINSLKDKYNDLKIILTGGDAIFFDKKLKNTIFVNLNLTSLGLNQILEHNKPND